MYDIDLKYGQQWLGAASKAGEGSWRDSLTAMGCAVTGYKDGVKGSWMCEDPVGFFERFPRSLDVCKCTNFPVSISNSQGDMKCAMTTGGEYACL